MNAAKQQDRLALTSCRPSGEPTSKATVETNVAFVDGKGPLQLRKRRRRVHLAGQAAKPPDESGRRPPAVVGEEHADSDPGALVLEDLDDGADAHLELDFAAHRRRRPQLQNVGVHHAHRRRGCLGIGGECQQETAEPPQPQPHPHPG